MYDVIYVISWYIKLHIDREQETHYHINLVIIWPITVKRYLCK
jgi:hypothetical protein